VTRPPESSDAYGRRLVLIVAVSGLLIAIVGILALEILSVRTERASQEALQSIAEQAGRRLASYIAQQKTLLRALAGAVAGSPDAARKLAQATLDAPSLGKVAAIDARTPPAGLPRLSPQQFADALGGKEASSALYTKDDLTPAMDICVPAPGAPGQAVCAMLDLLELQREVQRIRVGNTGFALAFDADGRLFAAGAGEFRAFVVSGNPEFSATLRRAWRDARRLQFRADVRGFGGHSRATWVASRCGAATDNGQRAHPGRRRAGGHDADPWAADGRQSDACQYWHNR